MKKYENAEKKSIFSRFFKTGKGQYGEGDIFYGLSVPQQRVLAKKYSELELSDLEKLLESRVHEERLTALIILTNRYAQATKMGDEKLQESIYEFYRSHLSRVNNWDLVDTSADKIFGHYLFTKRPTKAIAVLTKLAHSENLWERRVSIISTFYTIKNGNPEPTLTIAELLLNDRHDLIHKAVGWMLREVGKRCSPAAEKPFLEKHAHHMPRTMLRYAIEHLSTSEKKRYMAPFTA